MKPRRAALCVPASEAAKVAKATALAVDEVVVDLEDAVTPDLKVPARQQVVALTDRSQGTVAVRVNGRGTPWFEEDLAACAANRDIDSVVLPKVESREDLIAVDRILTDLERDAGRPSPLRVQALIESARGVSNVGDIATSSARLDALIIGYADLAASIGRHADGPWGFVRDAVLLAARAAGIRAIDGPRLSVHADDHLLASAIHVKHLGFDGKWVIHPRQIDIVQSAFSPSAAEVADAREVLATMEKAQEQGLGAVQWHGRMLDEAVAVHARRVLARAGS